MSYEIFRSSEALRQLRQLHRTSPRLVPGIIAAIAALTEDPRPAGTSKLVNRAEWRIRVGDYRVLYQIDDKNRAVIVVSVSHRRDVYR